MDTDGFLAGVLVRFKLFRQLRSAHEDKLMHHSLCTLAAGGALALAFSDAALAQSSVQLYGLIDVFAYGKQLAGEARVKRLDSGGQSFSSWGVHAQEDLGGGLSAAAELAGFLSADTGASGRSPADAAGFWGKYAWVALQSSRLGALRLGRQSTPTFINTIRFEPYGGSPAFGIALHTYAPTGSQPMLTANGAVGTNAAGSSVGGDSAWNNAVGYVSPLVNGFSGQALVSASESGTTPAAGRRGSAALYYNSGLLDLGLSFDRIDKTSAVLIRTKSDPAGAPYTLNEVNTLLASASYNFGVAKLYAQRFASTLRLAAQADVKLTTTQLGASIPSGVARATVSWLHTTRSQAAVADKQRDTVSISYDYYLSKRTDLYAVLLRDRVTSLATGIGAAAGIRHQF